MQISLKEIASFVSARVTGQDDILIADLLNIEKATPGSLTFLGSKAYEKFFANTGASAILVGRDFEKTRDDIVYLEVENPYQAFLLILKRFFTYQPELTGIDPSASVDPTATVGQNTAIGKNVVIAKNCRIGSGVKIFHNTVILEESEVGDETVIFPNVTIREKSRIGKSVIIHNGASVGADGFGFVKGPDGNYLKIPQIGNVIIEDFVEIGANTTIDRAALGSTVIKAHTKIDNLVQIGHNVEIGENTAISAQTGVSGSTKIGNNVIVAGQVGFVDHIEIGDGVIIGAQSGVSRSILQRGIYAGSPVKELNLFKKTEVHIRNLAALTEQVKLLKEELEALKKEQSKP